MQCEIFVVRKVYSFVIWIVENDARLSEESIVSNYFADMRPVLWMICNSSEYFDVPLTGRYEDTIEAQPEAGFQSSVCEPKVLDIAICEKVPNVMNQFIWKLKEQRSRALSYIPSPWQMPSRG